VRFLTHDAPQTTSKMVSASSAGHTSGSQSGLSALDHWNPSAILGRDGNTLVLKDTKTLPARKSTGQDHATMDCLSLNIKPVLISNQSGSSRWVFLSFALSDLIAYVWENYLEISGRFFFLFLLKIVS